MSRQRKWSTIGAGAAVLAAGLVILLCLPLDSSQSLPNEPDRPTRSIESEDEPPTLPPLAYFHDRTRAAGIDFACKNGEEAGHYTLLESLGGGVALFDYDGDGLLDVFLIGGGTFGGPEQKQIVGLPGKLYKNLGNWKFRDVTAEVGLDRPLLLRPRLRGRRLRLRWLARPARHRLRRAGALSQRARRPGRPPLRGGGAGRRPDRPRLVYRRRLGRPRRRRLPRAVRLPLRRLVLGHAPGLPRRRPGRRARHLPADDLRGCAAPALPK
jgi:hypothetical protein